MARLTDFYRTAFITGASTGLGRAFTEMLLADGVRVWGTSRSVDRLAPLAKAHPGTFTAVALELGDGERVLDTFRTAERDAGGFDIIINNAGYSVFGEFTATDFALWEKQIDVMLVQPARLAQAALKGMRARSAERRSAAIVNIASIAGEFPMPFQSIYNTVKCGLFAFSESLMLELAGTNVIVIDFRPGDFRTEFDSAVVRPVEMSDRMRRAWDQFSRMMTSGPTPEGAALDLRRALLKRRSATVRTGRFFQAVLAPFLARFGSLSLKRRIQARYFDVA